MAINFPSNPSNNDTYSFNNITWTFDGTRWRKPTPAASAASSTVVSSTEPAGNVATGTIWFDTNASTTKIYSGSGWTEVSSSSSGSIEVSNTTPSSPTAGTLWFNTDTNIIKVYDGSQWIESTVTADQLNLGTGAFLLPAGNTLQRPAVNETTAGMFRYNTEEESSEFYTEAEGWSVVAKQFPPPTVTAASPTTFNGESGTQVTVTGTDFRQDATVIFINSALTQFPAAATIIISDTELLATTPQDFTVSDGPLAVRVSQYSGFSTLTSAINTGNAPVWATLSGSFGTKYEDESVNITLSAPDSDAGATVTFALQSGSLPLGLTLASDGTLSGTIPQTDNVTTYNFTIRATDNAGNHADRSFSMVSSPASITWTTTAGALPNANNINAYSQSTVATSSGNVPITYSITSGSLPTGLSLNSSTGAITGTAVDAEATYTFTVRASTTYRTSDREFSITQVLQVVASGGSESTVNGYKYHTFTSSGTLNVTSGGKITVMMVGGGGGGGSTAAGGGGGAGAYVYKTNHSITPQNYSIVIGDGGAGAAATDPGSPYGSDGVVRFASNGGNTTAFGLTALGGGSGGSNNAGSAGGCGGGSATASAGGTSTASTISDGVGFAGSSGGSGGGGGIGAAASGITGGAGLTISGATSISLGGGGQGANSAAGPGTNSYGGGNGGTNGGWRREGLVVGSNGTSGKGAGGGGGASAGGAYYFYLAPGGTGGSGIVIVKYSV